MQLDKVEDTAPARASRREWIGLAVLGLSALVYAMDLTVLHLAVPRLSAALQPTSAELLWIIDIYGFVVAGALITMGTLGDRIGRRKLLMIGAAGFALTSVLAAVSNSPATLISSRALMGVAGATLAPSTLSLIFVMFQDQKQRSFAIGWWIAAFSAGSAVGPVVGGVMLEHFWWGSVFLLALPVMATLLVLGPRVLPEYKHQEGGSLDIPSAALSLGAILAVIFALKEATQNGFGAFPLVAVVVGLVLGGFFVRRQRALTDPLIDLHLFRNRTFNASLATNVFVIFIAIGYFLFVAQYLQLVVGLSPFEAGMWSIPSAIGFVIGSTLAPRFIHRMRPGVVIASCMVLGSLGLIILSQVGAQGGLPLVVLSSVVIALGMAPVFNLTTELIVGSAPPEKAGLASAISETGAELGGALGLAILGRLGTAVYRSQVAGNMPAGVTGQLRDAAVDTLGGAASVASQLPSNIGSALLRVAQEAFSQGLRVVAGVSAVLALFLALTSAILLRRTAGVAQDVRPRSTVLMGQGWRYPRPDRSWRIGAKGIQMGKLTYAMSVSLDGYISGPGGEFDWSAPDEELHRFHNERSRRLGAHLLGRRLYEVMLPWEKNDDWATDYEREFARIWRSLPKVVFSTTLESVEGNARLATGDITEEVARLKQQSEGDLAVGGAGLAEAMTRLGLIDEYELFVNPTVVGGGSPFFGEGTKRFDLELTETRVFGDRVVYLRYRRI